MRAFRRCGPISLLHSGRIGVPGTRGGAWRSGRERFLLHIPLVEDRDRLEAVVAGPAMPEIGGSAGAGLDPLGHRDRLAAVGAGISLGQIRLGTSHGTLPLYF